MKLTKTQLRQIIREEIQKLNEINVAREVIIDLSGVARHDIKELENYLEDNYWDWKKSGKTIKVYPHSTSRHEFQEFIDYIDVNAWSFRTK